MIMVPYLYPVPPIGIGTPGVESLTGYVTRLAGEHLLHPHVLIREVRRVARQALGRAFADPEFFQVHARRVDGTCESGRRLADVLADLTGQPEVRSLTMARWSDVLDPSQKFLFKLHRAWCPECHVERTMQGKPPYEPLLWKLSEVAHCHRHGTRLRTECPECRADQSTIPQYGWLTLCQKCGDFLGMEGEDDRDPELPDPKERHRIESFGRLLGRHNATEERPTQPEWQDRVSRAWERSSFPEMQAPDRLREAVRDNVHRWRKPRHRPTLRTASRFAALAEVDLVWLLDGHGEMTADLPDVEQAERQTEHSHQPASTGLRRPCADGGSRFK